MTNLIRPEWIQTGSVYPVKTLPERTAGTVAYVITRHWPRGLRKDGLRWAPDMAPSADLLKAYKHGGMTWDDFAAAYRAEMLPRLPDLRQWFAEMQWWHCDKPTITLLCHEHDAPEDTVRCHRRLLREMLLETGGDAS